MRAFLVLLLLTPTLAPLATAADAFDAQAGYLFRPHNLVAGQMGAYLGGHVSYEGELASSILLAVVLDGVRVGSATYWNQGEWVGVDFDVPANMSGARTLSLVMDADDRIAEANESNNVASIDVFVHPAPFYDIEPLRLRVPQYVFAGEAFIATAEVQVRGEPEVGGNMSADGTGYMTRLWIDGELTGGRFHMNLSPGITQQGWYGLTLPAGEHSYQIEVDIENSSFELSETNNVVRGYFYVQAAPADAVVDLEIEQPTLQTDLGAIAPHPTDRTAHVQVCNEGAMHVPAGEVRLEMRTPGLSVLAGGAKELLSVSFSWLAPGECRAWEVEYTLAAVGDHELVATVQAEAEVALDNNVETAQDFFVVGGAGGFAPR
jgi:hypothetical protein